MSSTLKAFGYSRDDNGRAVVRETVRPQRDDTPASNPNEAWNLAADNYNRRPDWHGVAK